MIGKTNTATNTIPLKLQNSNDIQDSTNQQRAGDFRNRKVKLISRWIGAEVGVFTSLVIQLTLLNDQLKQLHDAPKIAFASVGIDLAAVTAGAILGDAFARLGITIVDKVRSFCNKGYELIPSNSTSV